MPMFIICLIEEKEIEQGGVGEENIYQPDRKNSKLAYDVAEVETSHVIPAN